MFFQSRAPKSAVLHFMLVYNDHEIINELFESYDRARGVTNEFLGCRSCMDFAFYREQIDEIPVGLLLRHDFLSQLHFRITLMPRIAQANAIIFVMDLSNPASLNDMQAYKSTIEVTISRSGRAINPKFVLIGIHAGRDQKISSEQFKQFSSQLGCEQNCFEVMKADDNGVRQTFLNIASASKDIALFRALIAAIENAEGEPVVCRDKQRLVGLVQLKEFLMGGFGDRSMVTRAKFQSCTSVFMKSRPDCLKKVDDLLVKAEEIDLAQRLETIRATDASTRILRQDQTFRAPVDGQEMKELRLATVKRR
ncbi:MAG: hypothetical protein A2103_03645 [Gammaproteobacteria bacterium GWF2_41_13]|nr:MAG: hypothetical protein A2103_03645 [Gammaproteobacteria bacterium GWF2_41_13]